MKFIFPILFLLFFINVNSREGRYHNNEQHSNYKNVYVSEVLYNGAFLVLSDNSTWYIKPRNDQNIVYGWISPGKIQVKNNNNGGYPYLLFNTLTQDGVQAKKISRKEINEIEYYKSINSAEGRDKPNLQKKKPPNKMKVMPKKKKTMPKKKH